MKKFLENRQGQTVRLIIELDAQKQPTHFYDGQIVTVVEDAVILKDPQLGEIAVSPEKITAVQILKNPTG